MIPLFMSIGKEMRDAFFTYFFHYFMIWSKAQWPGEI